jgi:hypothetical protein
MQKFLKYLSGYPGLILIFSCYVGLRLWQVYQIFPFAGDYHDTINYMKTAEIPLLSVDFWGAIRPFMTPLVFKIAALNPVWIGWLQACISIFCWGFLIYQATTFIKKPNLRIAGLVWLLLFSMVYNISGWDVQLLSESLALSFQALLLGTFFWLLRGWAWRKVVFAGLAAFFWSNTRDVNPWMLMSYIGVIFLAGVLLKPYRRFIYLSIILGIIFLFSQWSVNYTHRWRYPYVLNVMPLRVLTNRNAMDFFEACDMPITNDKDAYDTWLYSRGKYCFVRWMIANPTWTLTTPLNDWNVMLGFDPIEQYDYFQKEFPTLLPKPIERLLYPAEYGVLFWWIGGIVIGLMAASRLRNEPACILVITSFLLVYPFILLSWHTDTLEIGRHALQTQCLMFFCLWLMLLFLLDYFLDKLPHRPDNPIPEKEMAS